MNDTDVRALMVKTLTEDQLGTMHLWEEQHGIRMQPAGAVQLLGSTPLKRYYGIPECNGRVQAKALKEWGRRVRGVMDRFTREARVYLSVDCLEDVHAFDRAVSASDLDFYYRTATATKRATRWREGEFSRGDHE